MHYQIFRKWGYASLVVLTLPGSAASAAVRRDEERLRGQLSGVRVPFIANRGQTDAAVAYYAPTFAGTLYVTRRGEIVYSFPGRRSVETGHTTLSTSAPSAGWSLSEAPVDAVRGRGTPSGNGRSQTLISVFKGNDASRWKSGIATYDAVSMGEVWPRVTMSLQAEGSAVEKVFRIEAGGDPSRIRMRVSGACSSRTDTSGALILSTPFGDVTFSPPVAFQEQAGVRTVVPVAYRLEGEEYGFDVSDYDATLPLVVDPILQATYLGGSDMDAESAIAIDPTTGDVYVTGQTASTNFPGTAGGAQPVLRDGSGDAFVARLNAGLTTLIQATYLGGSQEDAGYAIAIHPTSGDVYVAGSTASSDFPGTPGGAQHANGGTVNAFVARLNSALTTIKQATYLGGNQTDQANSLAIHPTTGDIYLAGSATSSNFPGTTGGAQPAYGGGSGDAFVARLNAGLTALTQATYLGGSDFDAAVGIAIHPTSGAVYVTGESDSSNFPGTAGGAQPASRGGPGDAFVACLSAGLTTLTQATYLGGGGKDIGFAIAIHPTSGDVYVAGGTGSSDFPGTGGGAQTSFGGGSTDAFVARLNAGLTTLIQATYLGGDDVDVSSSIAIDPTSGGVYVAGATASLNFPGVSGGVQPVFGGGQSDAFVALLNAGLTTLTQATYLGGSGTDGLEVGGVAIHPTLGDVFLAGGTDSSNFPKTSGGAQPSPGGDLDAFVARLTPDLLGSQGTCVSDPTSLCLTDGRFKVRAHWATSDGRSGDGQAITLTSDTGYFWFFSSTNVEMVIKVLNACGVNSHFWVFAGGLTNVQVDLTVTDTLTGTVKIYQNFQDTPFQPIQDTGAFATCSAGLTSSAPTGSQERASVSIPPDRRVFLPESSVSERPLAGSICTADATTLCLSGGRFQVRANWQTTTASGQGTAVGLTSDTGYFWFFSASNVEMIVKVLDACGINTRKWVFAGGLTNVSVVMTVTDTQTGAVKMYANPQSTAFLPIQDTGAFSTCP